MNTPLPTEKQQEVLWLRYGRKASVDQIAKWLGITRRAVLMRLRNARRRAENAGILFAGPAPKLTARQIGRRYSISQISRKRAEPMDEL